MQRKCLEENGNKTNKYTQISWTPKWGGGTANPLLDELMCMDDIWLEARQRDNSCYGILGFGSYRELLTTKSM